MKRVIVFLGVFLLALSVARPSYPFWIWTPKTGKWVNPKNMPKSNPKEQFDFAKGFYTQKSYKEAKIEFQRLIKAYPKSAEAAESQYYLGLIGEAEGDLYAAYQAYQKVVDKYPFSERIQEIVEREYKIGEAFMQGQAKRKAFGVALPVDNPAIEIFTKVVENSTFGPYAPKAQYKLGLVLKELLRYYEAEEAFNKLISNYPSSEWVEAAKFQLATCRQATSRGPEYDQGAGEEAKRKFEEFVREYPDAVLSDKAKENLAQLNERDAESSYNIGRFYEKQKAYESAKVYYNDIINNYVNSAWAKKAAERLQMLENKK